MLLTAGKASPGAEPPTNAVVVSTATNQSASPSNQAPVSAAQDSAKARPAAGRVQLNAALSHSTYSQSNPASLLLKVDLAASMAESTNRTPRNIALVLDRSASMADEQKFPLMMEAARSVIENLTPHDLVSLVAFNDHDLVLSPAGRVVNKPFLLHRLQEVPPTGYGDMSAGLLEAFAQINGQARDGQLKQVILLTDGRANRGVTGVEQLHSMIDKAREKGVRLLILGFGTNRNEKLLTDMAAAGGGRYVYLQSPDQIPGAFADDIGGLLEVAAQNAHLEISVQQGTITKVFGQLWEGPSASYQVNLGDVRAFDRGSMVLALRPVEFKPGAAIRVTAKLTYDNPETAERVSRDASAQSDFAVDGGKKSSENAEVVTYGGIMNALELATEGAAGFDRQRYQQSLTGFAQWYKPAHELALSAHNQDLLNQTFMLKHLLNDMEAADRLGRMHDHTEARQKLKGIDYQRYLLFHHRVPNEPDQSTSAPGPGMGGSN
jgi:Ca-activated chloride channel family protein